MSTATLLHQPQTARDARKTERTGAAPEAAPARTQAEQDAHETRVIASLAGAAALIILVFWIGMMWWLSGYGPTV